MFCPSCQENLEKAIFYGVEIDYCPKCLGLWFEEDELRLAKDKKDDDLSWLDINLWKDRNKFKISRKKKLCPFCRLPLYEVNYGESPVRQAQGNVKHVEASPVRQAQGNAKHVEASPVRQAQGNAKHVEALNTKVDLCNLCYGIWLDRGEFKNIIEYLKERKDYEILNNYAKNLTEAFWEIFIGPEDLREEFADFLALLKVLIYKFSIQHPALIRIIASLPSK